MTTLEFRPIVTPQQTQAWDDMVGECSGGTIYHMSCWQKMLRDTDIAGDFEITGAYAGGELVGGYTGLVRKTLGVPTIVTPLCTPYCGLILSYDSSELQLTWSAFLSGMSSYKRVSFQCLDLEELPHESLPTSVTLFPRRTWEIDLRLEPETLWRQMRSSVQRQIRKAEKHGVTITEELDLERGYEMLHTTFSRQREACPISRSLFAGIVSHAALDHHRRIFAADHNGQLVGFVVALHDRRRVYYALASSSAEGMAVGASSLLIWKVIQSYTGSGFSTFDFVGGNNPSISKFKENFGPALKQYHAIESCTSPRLRVAYAVRGLIRSAKAAGRFLRKS